MEVVTENKLYYTTQHRRIWGHILGGAHINSGLYEEKWPRLQLADSGALTALYIQTQFGPDRSP